MASSKITRSPFFWIAHVLFFLVCLLYTWKNFYRAFPFVELDVKMDRKGALQAASDLAAQRHWAPNGAHRDAVSFDIDSSTQNFIELEAGGPQELRKVLQEGIYNPYLWRVRHFAEGKTNETHVQFTPDGKPYGFAEKISEEDPGASLSTEQARAIAEKAASGEWGIDLAPYRLAEHSSEVRKSKRVDHSFIYEREKERVGEGRYRLRLTVSGDRLSEVARYIKVPDAFFRRYSSMRSANGTIATLAMAAIVLLYGIVLCGFGLFTLARSHWVIWRMPLIVAGVISSLQILDALNRLPLEWMSYDTAISTQAFILRQVAGAVIGGLFDFLIVAIPIMAAESMTRRAFPEHPQFWRIFSREAAASKQVFGRVVGAYLFVAFHFAYVMWIYQVGAKYLHWWNPSELLFHPDALATYFPWLTSVANSLHAGIWEECLFRAVPLAGAALLGNRYGKRGAFIAVAFVLQAIIFGSAHASYPTQPSYARVVELIVPSFVFGGTYLAFGMLPGIIMHYTYDVALFAMPLFLSSGRSAWINRLLVIAVSGLPLWIVLAARLREGAWRELPAGLYNRAWRPELAVAPSPGPVAEPVTHPVLTRKARWSLLAAGLAALGIWAGLSSFRADAPGLRIGREEAVAVARRALADKGVKLGADWQALAKPEGTPDEEDLFVWRTSGQDEYRKLMGTYLEPPHWKVRFARFEGDLIERAEEYQVFLGGKGEIERIRHEIPEARAGAVLDEGQARKISEDAVRKRYGLEPSKLKEISSNQYKLPNRLDWIFTWQDPSVELKEGEARLAVKLSGDEVVGTRQYVHVPEEWLRKERSRKTALNVVMLVCGAGLSLLALWITFVAFHGWIRGGFHGKAFALTFGLFIAVSFILRINEYPMSIAEFSTSQPWASQVLRLVISYAIVALLTSALAALWLGRVHSRRVAGQEPPARRGDVWVGYACGAILAALAAVAGRAGRAEHPVWPSVGAAGAVLPWLEALQGVAAYVSGVAFLMLLIPWIEERIKRGSSRLIALIALGLATGAFLAENSIGQWVWAGLGSAAVFVAVFELVRRTSATVLIPLVAAATILRAVRVIEQNAFPGAVLYGVLLIAGVSLVSVIWFGVAESERSS